MLTIFSRRLSIIVLYSISLHLVWATLTLLDPAALNATGPAAIYLYIHPPILFAIVLYATSILAILALFLQFPWVVLLLLPQQILLMMSAAGAFEAIWLGQFADGILRPHNFIAADQMYSILTSVGHTVAIIMHARRRLQ